MTTAIVIAVFALILAIDYWPLKSKLPVKDKIVYGAIMLCSLCVLILYTLDIPVPSPTPWIIKGIEQIIPSLNQ